MPNLRSRATGKRVSRGKPVRTSKDEETLLVNAIGAAASRDLAARTAAVEAEEAALVNAVARAAARSLTA